MGGDQMSKEQHDPIDSKNPFKHITEVDTIPMNEEKKQWEEDDGEYISLEDLKKELGFQPQSIPWYTGMKDLNYYMSLPYTIQIKEINDESGRYFFATVRELKGCMSDGETIEEAYENIREAMEAWISCAIEYNDPIPEPLPQKNNNSEPS